MAELFISAMPYYEQNAVIKVICAGGAGINIVSGMPALSINNVEYIAVVSAPHKTAGAEIINTAKEGLAELISCVDSYATVPNEVMQ